MTAPIAYTAVRYRCPHCRYSRTRRATTSAHIGRCWHNPETRTCRTCDHFDRGGAGRDCFPGRPCDCDEGPESCMAGIDLPSDGTPIVRCVQWTQREVDR